MQNGARVRRSPGRGPQARAGHPHPDLAIPYNSGIRTCPAWNVQLETTMVAKWGMAARPPGRGPKAGLRAPGRCGPPGTCHPEQSPGLRAVQWFLLGTLGLQGGGGSGVWAWWGPTCSPPSGHRWCEQVVPSTRGQRPAAGGIPCPPRPQQGRGGPWVQAPPTHWAWGTEQRAFLSLPGLSVSRALCGLPFPACTLSRCVGQGGMAELMEGLQLPPPV